MEIPQQHAQAAGGAQPRAVVDVSRHVQGHGDLAAAVRLGPVVVVDAVYRGSRVLDDRAAGRVWADIEPDVPEARHAGA
jgi:hypothetical protein